MKNLSRIIISFILSILCIFALVSPFKSPIFSGDVEDLEEEIEQKEQEIEENKSLLEQIEDRIAEISNSKYSLSEKISLLEKEITEIEKDIENKDKEIDIKLKEIDGKEKLLAKKQILLETVSGELYVESRFGFYNFLFSGKGLDDFIESLYVRKSAISVLTDEIEEISGEFSNLAEAKSNLEDEKKELDDEREELDESYDLLAAEQSKLQTELNAQIAEKNAVKRTIGGITFKITELQQTILYLKGGGGLTDADAVSSNATPTTQLKYFRDNAPAGTFGIFSFGASTHRNGMSQWGAWERAQQGQTYQDILNAYYPGKTLQTGTVKINGVTENIMANIKIDGYGTKSFEDYYLLGIREIIPDWNNIGDIELLKAQAIAARTFAVRTTDNGDNTICTTEYCQVFSTSFYGGAWKTAVEQTEGIILVNSDKTPAITQFAAVHGGWINTLDAYDVKSGSGDWYTRAWEALSGVNWFYMNWYQRKSASGYVSCSTKPNPWLSGEELADILNAYKYWMSLGTSNTDIDPRLTAIDVQQCWGDSANPYSWNELKAKVNNPIKKVLSATTTNSNGWTTGLNFAVKLESGATSTFTISGTSKTLAFRDIFNLRAPGFYSIPQVQSDGGFVHINIETGIN